MITILHPEGFDCPAAARLKALGFVWHSFVPDEVSDLDHGTEELLYLVPFTAMKSPNWPILRVRLARSNRYFLAYVRECVTSDVVECLRDGAHDVLALLDGEDRWRGAILKAVEDQGAWLQLYGGRPLGGQEVLIGRSAVMERLRRMIGRFGGNNTCVLLTGESGVGKGRVADALHKTGSEGPFVALNCAAIPKDLLESELFGVEKGAFTGALKTRPGLVEQADGGTLFLDEIGEMEMAVQPKLLRFLETRRARRVGGESEYWVKTRIISATNRNLETEVANKRFRADLYYRLGEIILPIPPLRDRPEDIPELATAFLSLANERFGKNIETLEPGLIKHFQDYDWPGNVRELKSAIDRLVLLFDGPVLRESWWDPPESRTKDAPETSEMPRPASSRENETEKVAGIAGLAASGSGLLPNHKQKVALARQLLQESDNNHVWVAAQLGINPTTLWRWRKAGKLGGAPRGPTPGAPFGRIAED